MDDPNRYYMVERLIGAALMASALLDQEGESENAHKVALVLRQITDYFVLVEEP